MSIKIVKAPEEYALSLSQVLVWREVEPSLRRRQSESHDQSLNLIPKNKIILRAGAA
jgi:hypothetical protein